MRVLQVSNFYPPYWVGGYEQIAEWVAEGLRQRGHEVEVLTGRGPAFDERPEIRGDLDLDLAAFSERYFGESRSRRDGIAASLRQHIFSPRNFRACRRAIAEFQPQLLSCWNLAYVSFSPLLAARASGVPAILHLSDQVANPFRSAHSTPLPQRLRAVSRTAVDLLLRSARPAQFVVPSGFLKDKFTTHEGLPADRTAVLPWCVEPTISAREAPARAEQRCSRLLFVGTLIPEKGPEFLIAALRGALREQPNLQLTIVGEGPSSFVDKLRSAAAGLPVRFAGRLDREGVIKAYQAHDVLVFPSVWDEPYAVVPLEAMAMGLAVIATTAGGTPEAVVHEKTGLLVPPGDVDALRTAILGLSSDPERVRRLSAAGQAWARDDHSFPVFMERLERLYESFARRAAASEPTATSGGMRPKSP